MKIHVIDNTGRIQPLLLATEADVTFFSDEIQALNAVDAQMPGLILLNYALRGEETAEYIDLLVSRCSASSIVVIGDDLGDGQVLKCLLAGAKGYQTSRDLAAYIKKIVKVVADGEAWITRRMTARLLDAIRLQNLSLSNSLIAPGLYVSSSLPQQQ